MGEAVEKKLLSELLEEKMCIRDSCKVKCPIKYMSTMMITGTGRKPRLPRPKMSKPVSYTHLFALSCTRRQRRTGKAFTA